MTSFAAQLLGSYSQGLKLEVELVSQDVMHQIKRPNIFHCSSPKARILLYCVLDF